jgi:serine/threonine protein kinase
MKINNLNNYYIFRNIFLKLNGQIKLGDFGVSKTIDEITSTASSTVSVSAVGTIPYMSPEMISHLEYSYETDCWSTGCTVYELICQEKFFDLPKKKYNRLSNLDSCLLAYENNNKDVSDVIKEIVNK